MATLQRPSVLGKRPADHMNLHLEASLTEYYRQECLRSLYKTQDTSPTPPPQRRRVHEEEQQQQHARDCRRIKRVSIAPTPEIIGSADPCVDRSPIDVSPFSQLEMMVLLAQRTFPVVQG